ncbi:MAG: HEAT repeat domain-containing protein [Candidatus Odinarchaeia archaeon]
MKKDVEGLIKILKKSVDRDDKTTGAVVMALLRLGPLAVEPLIRVLNEESNPFLKFLIIRILEKMRAREAADTLIRIVEEYYENQWKLEKLKREKPKLAQEISSVYYAALLALKKIGVTPDEIKLERVEDREKLKEHYNKI